MIRDAGVELHEVGGDIGGDVAPHDFDSDDEVKDCSAHEREDGVDVAVIGGRVHGVGCVEGCHGGNDYGGGWCFILCALKAVSYPSMRKTREVMQMPSYCCRCCCFCLLLRWLDKK